MKKIVIEISEKNYKDLISYDACFVDFWNIIVKATPLEEVLGEIKGEIDKQYKWLMCTNHTLADIDIAFDAVKYSIDKHISGKEEKI